MLSDFKCNGVPGGGKEARKRNISIASNPVSVCQFSLPMCHIIRLSLYLTEVLVRARAHVGHVGPLGHSAVALGCIFIFFVVIEGQGEVDTPVAHLLPPDYAGLGVAAELCRQDLWIRP